MLKHLKVFLPSAETLRKHPLLLRMGKNIQHSPIWSLNRHSACRGMCAGMFIAFLPLPMRTAPLIVLCIKTGAHLPLAVACTWIFNFVVMAPVFYLAYQLGLTLLQQSAPETFIFDAQHLLDQLSAIWQPLFLGSLIYALTVAVIAYYATAFFWRYRILKRWKKRHHS